MEISLNHIVEFLKANGFRIDRENYLAVMYLGNPPEQLDAEQDAEVSAAINVAVDAQFMSLVTGDDRKLLHDMGIRICEPVREFPTPTAGSDD